MLLTKLLANIRSARQILTRKRHCSLFSTQCKYMHNEGTACKESSDIVTSFYKSTSKTIKEAAKKCPEKEIAAKKARKIKKVDPPKTCADDIIAHAHAAEKYLEVFNDMRKKALDVEIYTRNSVNALYAEMLTNITSRANSEHSRMLWVLKNLEGKINQIMRLSKTCGDSMKLECYSIAERINVNLKTWNCENESGEQRIESWMRSLECKVKERTNTAVEVVRTCKGCVSSRALIQCVETTYKDAAYILNKTLRDAKHEISLIKELRDDILSENNLIVDRLMQTFDRECAELGRRLDDTLRDLKRKKSC